MPEIGRDDREYWLKMLMKLGVEAHRLGENLFEEERLFDPNGSVREQKMAVYGFECECNARNSRLIDSVALSARQRALMKWRYIKKKPWGDVFRFMNTTLRYTYEMHKRALQRVLIANEGRDFKEEYHAEKARLDKLNPYTKEL